jgi:MFS transporter, DHA2 family, multidrug resistance protein
MSAALASDISAGDRRVITVAVVMAMFMQGVNVSVPNAALSYIQGSLSMADDEIGWLFTSYIAASAIAIPMTPWFAGRFGRRLVFQISIVIFTLGIVLDTLATTPIQLVLARIVQGAAGGSLVPLSTAILLDLSSPSRRARVGLSVLACVLLGISSGPSIGGWLSEYHGWHSIFYFSLPMAGFIFLAVTLSLPEKKAEQRPSFDFFGFAALSLGVTGLQMLLDRGERLEWFDSSEIWVEACASVLGFYMFFVHILTTNGHYFDKGLFRDRNFVLSTIVYFGVGFVLLPTLALTSPMMEELLNYPVDTTGYVTIARGITLVGALVLTSFLPARIDNRMPLIGGMALVAYADWRMIHYSPAMDWQCVVTALLLQGAGLGISIPPLTRTAFGTLDQRLQREAGPIFNQSRLYGGTIGIAVVQIFFYGNTQSMHLALAKNLAPYRAAAHFTGPLTKRGLAALNDMITGQAAVVAIIGQFKILFFAILIVSPLVLFLRKPRPAVQLAEPSK